jgi:hypothetical protein
LTVEEKKKKDVSNTEYVSFGKVTVSKKGEEEKEEEKLTKDLAFVRRATTTTIKEK